MGSLRFKVKKGGEKYCILFEFFRAGDKITYARALIPLCDIELLLKKGLIFMGKG